MRLIAELKRVALALSQAVAGSLAGAHEAAAGTLAEVAARAAEEAEKAAAIAVRKELRLRLKAPREAKPTVLASLRAAELPIRRVRAGACTAAATSEKVVVPEQTVDRGALVKIVRSQMTAVQASVAEAAASALGQQAGRGVAHKVAKHLRAAAAEEASQLSDVLAGAYGTVESRVADVAAAAARRASKAAWEVASSLVKARMEELDTQVEVETTKAGALAAALEIEDWDSDTKRDLMRAEKAARSRAQKAAAERLRAEIETLELDEVTKAHILEHLDDKEREAVKDVPAPAPSAETGPASPPSVPRRSTIFRLFSRDSGDEEKTGKRPSRSKSASGPPRSTEGSRRSSF